MKVQKSFKFEFSDAEKILLNKMSKYTKEKTAQYADNISSEVMVDESSAQLKTWNMIAVSIRHALKGHPFSVSEAMEFAHAIHEFYYRLESDYYALSYLHREVMKVIEQ